MTSPGSSVPELRSRRKPMLVILIVLVVAIIGGVVAIVVMPESEPDPGPAACDHVERQAEMGPVPWDNYVDKLVNTVEERIKSPNENVFIKVRSTTREDRCRETLRKLSRALTEERYRALARCIASSTKAHQGFRCLELVQQ